MKFLIGIGAGLWFVGMIFIGYTAAHFALKFW